MLRSTYIAYLVFLKCLYITKLDAVKSHLVKSQLFCDFLAASLIDSYPKFKDIDERPIHWTLEP
jgi:hypothetical protein